MTMYTISFDKKVRVISALLEGVSIRATARLCGVDRETVMNLGVTVGEACWNLHDQLMRDVQIGVLELDEIWAFIGKKQKRLKPGDAEEKGDCYTFIGVAATQKAIVSYAVGKRDAPTANGFLVDLRRRIVGRPQISTDGFQPYLAAVGDAFGAEGADYAQVIKVYGQPDPADDRKYSPPRCIGIERKVIAGDPDPTKISTSFVERQNLTVRMSSRRFTRLTNAYSKKLRNHAAAFALYVCWYNFVRVHETLKITPAMALRLVDRPWSIADLVETALSMAPALPPITPALPPIVAPLPVLPPLPALPPPPPPSGPAPFCQIGS